MIQNNHIDAIEAPKAGSVGIVVLQDDAQQSPLTYIKGNSVRGFLVDMRVQAMSTNPQVKPVFLVKNNYFGGRFEREEGNTQSSVVILEDNFSSKTGGNFPAQIPEEGKWEKGQIVYFDNPQPGSYVGAVCIAKGTPGVWKLFGKIEE